MIICQHFNKTVDTGISPELVVPAGNGSRKESRIDMNINGFLRNNVFNLRNQLVHKFLRIVHEYFIGHPEAHPPAFVVGPGHSVGKHIIELRDRFRRKQGHPFAAFGLHPFETRFAFHGVHVCEQRFVVGYRKSQAAIGRNAVIDTQFH